MSTREEWQTPGDFEKEVRRALLALSHFLGEPARELALLAEGNVSAHLDQETFLVKASGSSLGTLKETGLVACRFVPLLAMLAEGDFTEQAIEDQLLACRVDPSAKKPSVESLFHAALLSLPGVNYVGHTHPVSVNGVLCSRRGRDFAERRMFPDQVVCCGVASVFVEYVDPGLQLGRVVRRAVEIFAEERGEVPRVILLENHGMIALGATPESVRAATLMTDKAAKIFLAAEGLGGARFLAEKDVQRLAGRLDERHRQKALGL